MQWTERDVEQWRTDWTWATRDERLRMLADGDLPDYALVAVLTLGWPCDVDLAHPDCRGRVRRAVMLSAIVDTVSRIRELLSLEVIALKLGLR